MRHRHTKYRPSLYSFYDHTVIETYLEEQAQRGWMLDKISPLGWRFHTIPPQSLHCSVVYFPKASPFDPAPSEAQLSFQELCAYTGWRLAVSDAQMQIFYNQGENPIPISTDPALEVATIHEAAKKRILPGYGVLAGFGLLAVAFYLWRLFSEPLGVITSNSAMFSFLAMVLLSLFSIVELGDYFRWYRRAKRAAELDGSFVGTRGHRSLEMVIFCLVLLAFIATLGSYTGSRMSLYLLAYGGANMGVIAITRLASYGMKKRGLPAHDNRNMTLLLCVVVSVIFGVILTATGISLGGTSLHDKQPVDTYEYAGSIVEVYHDDLSLTIEDLMPTDYEGYSYELIRPERSVLAEQQTGVQRPRWGELHQPELSYTITTIKAPLLYDWCKEALLRELAARYSPPGEENAFIEIDPAPWGAKEAYQRKQEDFHFLLCYQNCVVELSLSQLQGRQITPEQMRVVGEKLGAS